MLKDTLRCLKQLSLYLQNQDANILNASSHVDDTINKLQALKVIKIPVSVVVNVNSDDEISSDNESDGGDSGEGVNESIGLADREQSKDNVTTLSKFFLSFENDGHYKGIQIERKKTMQKMLED